MRHDCKNKLRPILQELKSSDGDMLFEANGYHNFIEQKIDKALYEIIPLLGCAPYCSMWEELLEILHIFPPNSKESQYAATKAKESISALQENKFQKMYYEAREELSKADNKIRELLKKEAS